MKPEDTSGLSELGQAARDASATGSVKDPDWRPFPRGDEPVADSKAGDIAEAGGHSQRFWLGIGFAVAVVVALVAGGGLLLWANPEILGSSSPSAAPSSRVTGMSSGDSIGNKSPNPGQSLADSPETETKPCQLNGIEGTSGVPCEADSELAGSAGTASPPAGGTGAGAAEAVKGCDGATIVAPAKGKLTALELRQKFEALGEAAGAEIAVAWYDPKYGLVTAGKEGAWPAWSTSKVPLAVAVMQDGKGLDLQASMRQAITASDNAAAGRLWQGLAASNSERAEAMNRVLRQAGDSKTVVPTEQKLEGYSIFGQTTWTPTNQVRLAAALPCLKDAQQVTEFMGQVIPDQRWGMGRLPGAVFKGGWGPSGEVYTVRQFGWYEDAGGNRVFLAMAVKASSMSTGIALLDSFASVLR